MFFIFTPTWGNDPIWRAYFSNGLVQPPTSSNKDAFQNKKKKRFATTIFQGAVFRVDRDRWSCFIPLDNDYLSGFMLVIPQSNMFHIFPLKWFPGGNSYCWWLKSCTTWDVWNPTNNGINMDKLPINWCRISAINSRIVKKYHRNSIGPTPEPKPNIRSHHTAWLTSPWTC